MLELSRAVAGIPAINSDRISGFGTKQFSRNAFARSHMTQKFRQLTLTGFRGSELSKAVIGILLINFFYF